MNTVKEDVVLIFTRGVNSDTKKRGKIVENFTNKNKHVNLKVIKKWCKKSKSLFIPQTCTLDTAIDAEDMVFMNCWEEINASIAFLTLSLFFDNILACKTYSKK